MPRQNEHNAGMKELPDDMLIPIYHYITGIHNATDKDVTELILKPGLSHVYIFFIIQYGLLSLCGVVLSIYTIGYILRYKLYRDVTQAILVNLSLCHFVQCAFVLPITLLLILAQNWVFGQFMCYFIPILQVSIHNKYVLCLFFYLFFYIFCCVFCEIFNGTVPSNPRWISRENTSLIVWIHSKDETKADKRVSKTMHLHLILT